MIRASLRVWLAVVVLVLPVSAAAQLTREQQAQFLDKAKIVKVEPIGKGVTRPFRLTLSDGSLTHDAAFQSVDESRSVSMHTGRDRTPELNFKDSWRLNIAAPRLAELIGIGSMVPVSVERTWNGKKGALTWWVDEVLMDEAERRKSNTEAPDKDEWNKQTLRMRVFTQLVHDTDRNQGNILITKDWRIVMIDFTRAFRPWDKTPSPLNILRRCDRTLLAGMRSLTKPVVEKEVGEYLTPFEIEGLLARRDAIVKHFDALVARLGEDAVLY
jgi:hypothetical protein